MQQESMVSIPPDEYRARRARAAALATDLGCDGMLVVGRSAGSYDNMANVFWLTHHAFVAPIVVPTGPWKAYGHDFVVIDGNGRSALATVGRAEPAFIDDIRLGIDVEQLAVDAVHDLGLTQGTLALVGSEVLPWTVTKRLEREFPDLRFRPADLEMAQLRATLSEAECAMLRQSTAVGSAILTAALQAVRVGATDGDVAAAGWGVAARTPHTQHWNFIMASGEHAGDYAPGAFPAWDPATPYRRGDLIHPDCYGYVDGYMYDVQRTMVVGQDPSPAQMFLLRGTWEMADLLGATLRDGVTCREIYETGVQFMRDYGYRKDEPSESWMEGGHFGHGYASGFDWPWLGITAPGADLPLAAPFAVTIELAWSSKDVGAVWVEENWLVTKDGPENLTASVPRTLVADAPGR
jgi:Xaa-Pro aminopeptidase